jgi:hypothetical protein
MGGDGWGGVGWGVAAIRCCLIAECTTERELVHQRVDERCPGRRLLAEGVPHLVPRAACWLRAPATLGHVGGARRPAACTLGRLHTAHCHRRCCR